MQQYLKICLLSFVILLLAGGNFAGNFFVFAGTQEDIDKIYKDEDVENAKQIYKYTIPYTKESLHYRKRFCTTFDDNVSNVIPYFWLPKWGNVKDPSARVLNVYKQQQE